MARRITRKQMKHDEFVEAAFDFGHWVEEHWQKVVGGAVVLVIAIMSGYGFVSWRSARAEAASRLLAEGLASYQAAVTSGDAAGLDQARDELQQAATKASSDAPIRHVALLGEALTELEAGNRERATALLQQVITGGGPASVVGTAKARLAETYVADGQSEDAARLWRELADDPNGFFPQSAAMLNLGRLLKNEGRDEEARQVLNDLLVTHPQSSAARAAQTILAGP